MARNRKLVWIFDEKTQIFSVDKDCEDYNKYRGVNVKMIADRAGHQNTHTTEEIYGHVFAKTRRATANEYDSLFGSRVAED